MAAPPKRKLNVAAVHRHCVLLDFTTTDLAAASGIERSHLSRMLDDKRSVRTAHVDAIARALGCSPLAILDPADPLYDELGEAS